MPRSLFARLSACPSLLALILTAAPASAQTDYFWNAPAGTGPWDTTTANWRDAVPNPYTWTNSGPERANFGDTAGTVTIAAGGITASGLVFTTTGYTINGGTLTLAGTNVIDSGAGTATINSSLAGTIGLTKNGAGTLVLGGASTYTGKTTVAAGTLALGATNALPTAATSVLQLGTFTGTGATAVSGSGQANFDLQGNSQTAGSLYSFNVNTTGTPHTITIGSGQNLTVSNNAAGIWTAFGAYNGTGGAVAHHTTFTGGGSLVINTPLGTFQVGKTGGLTANQLPSGYPTTATGDSGSQTTLNLQALSSFSATVANFRVGDFTGGGNAGSAILNLAPTTTIITGDFVAASGRFTNSTTAGSVSVRLGNVANTIQASNIYIGGDVPSGISNPRSQGELRFLSSTLGNLTVRDQAGAGGANLFVGVQRNGSGTFARDSTVQLNNHTVDILLNTFQVGGFTTGTTTANTGNVSGTFSFNQGTVSANAMLVGFRNGTSDDNHTATPSGIVNVGGGTLTVTGSGANALSIGSNTQVNSAASTAVTYTTAGTVNVSGGALNVPNGGITLATSTGTYASGAGTFATTGTLNITGGTVSVGGDIVKGAATSPGTATATLTLNGATADLNLNNNRIGGITAASSLDVVNLQAGTIRNVLEINNGAAPLNKTGAGTLTLAGTNAYTGGTTVTAGTLQMGAANTLPTTGAVNLNGGTLSTGATTGFPQTAGPLDLDASSTIALGTGSHILNFSGLAASPTGILTITGWAGPAFGQGTDGRIVFASNANFTQPFLDSVQFVGFPQGASLMSSGGQFELTPVPEPTTVLAIGAAGLGLVGLVRRRLRRRDVTLAA